MQVMTDVVYSYRPELKKKAIVVNVEPPAPHNLEGKLFPWDGFPGHLSQVVLNFFQNTNRYGYPTDRNGVVDIKIWEEGDCVPDSVVLLSRMFEHALRVLLCTSLGLK
jgi:signal transduction histidine kinase